MNAFIDAWERIRVWKQPIMGWILFKFEISRKILSGHMAKQKVDKQRVVFKAIIHFRIRFTNNLQGLQKAMVKDFSWNIIPWNNWLFEKTLKKLSILGNENYGL